MEPMPFEVRHRLDWSQYVLSKFRAQREGRYGWVGWMLRSPEDRWNALVLLSMIAGGIGLILALALPDIKPSWLLPFSPTILMGVWVCDQCRLHRRWRAQKAAWKAEDQDRETGAALRHAEELAREFEALLVGQAGLPAMRPRL